MARAAGPLQYPCITLPRVLIVSRTPSRLRFAIPVCFIYPSQGACCRNTILNLCHLSLTRKTIRTPLALKAVRTLPSFWTYTKCNRCGNYEVISYSADVEFFLLASFLFCLLAIVSHSSYSLFSILSFDLPSQRHRSISVIDLYKAPQIVLFFLLLTVH